MINKTATVYTLSINLFFLGLCLVFGNLRFGAIDDLFMSGILSGIYGENNVHLTFVNTLYGYCLLPLYYVFPRINWYYIGEMSSIFISLTIAGYIVIRKAGEKWGPILTMALVALCASDYYLVMQFTQCAAMLSAVGMLCIVYGFDKIEQDLRDKKKALIIISLGIVLLCWGSWMRWQAFLMGMPFFAMILLMKTRNLWNRKTLVFGTFLILFVSVFGCRLFDQHMYNSPEYKTYIEFQGPRALLGDGQNYNQQAVYEDLDEMGYSGKDFTMLTNWTFYDNEVFAPDSIRIITDVIDKYFFRNNLRSWPILVFGALQKSVQSPIFFAWMLFCFALFVLRTKKDLWVWLSLAMALSLIGYLLNLQRLVYRVETGLWLYATILTIPLLKEHYNISKKIVVMIVVLIAMCNLCVFAISGFQVRSPNTGELVSVQNEMVDYADYNGFQAYMDSLSDSTVFFMKMNSYMRLSRKRNPPYLAEPKGSWDRIYSFGFWTPYFPDVEKSFRRRGVSNPIKDVILDNVFVIDEPLLADFLERHYYEKVQVDTVRNFGGMVVYKYSLVADSLMRAEQ